MKKRNFLISIVTIASMSMAITSCGGDGTKGALPELQEGMTAIYSPSTGNIPLPNDLLFSGTTDLTLNIPVTDETDYSDPKVALSGLDGWSATTPFSINFLPKTSEDPSLISIDPESVIGGATVHVYKVNVQRTEISPGVIAPTGPVISVERELTVGSEYIVQATSATTIAIIPTIPFEQQASYMVVLTNGLKDSKGSSILPDNQYALVRNQTAFDPNSSIASLEPVRKLVNAMEAAASSFETGPNRANIIMSFQFTIQSIGTVMNAAKAVYIDGAIAAGALPQTSFTDLGQDTRPYTGRRTSTVNLYKGQITLPYFLQAPSDANPTAPLNAFWKTAEMVPDGQGNSVPNPAPLSHLTYANPLPQMNGLETVPLLVSIPKDNCVKPASGYPVVIFQHGLSRDRTDLIYLADTLGTYCIAGIAMDSPLHGIVEDHPTGLFEGYAPNTLRERTFGVDYVDNTTQLPGADGIVDESGQHGLNLANLLVVRDNMRQAIFDLLYLEKSIAYMDIDGDDQSDFNSEKISFIGYSLGGIIGAGFAAYADKLKSVAQISSGGGISSLLNASEYFGPTIRAGVAAGAGMEVSHPIFPRVLSQFLFTSQTVFDTHDPVSLTAFSKANNVPTLFVQVANDAKIPNSVVTAPLSGTEPLARILELTTVSADKPGWITGDHLFCKLNDGIHSSMFTPLDENGEMKYLNVMTEIQSQVVSFIATNGSGVMVVDQTLLAE